MNKGYSALAILAVALLILVGSIYAGHITGLFLSQETTVLNLDEYSFQYELSAFNDSEETKEFDFPEGGGEQTYYIEIPKNSTILDTSMTASGEITTVYQKEITSAGVEGLSIGDVTGDGRNEIVAGRRGIAGGAPSLFLINGSTGDIIWDYDEEEPDPEYITYSTDIGDLTGHGHNEIVFGNQNNYIYVLDGEGELVWSYGTGGNVRAVGIEDIADDTDLDVIAGDENEDLHLIDSDGEEIWKSSTGGTVRDLSTGDLLEDKGTDIAVASGNSIKIYNKTGHERFSKDIGKSIQSIKADGILDSEYYEIIIGEDTNDEVVMYSISDEEGDIELTEQWSEAMTHDINSIESFDVISEDPHGGQKEIIVGTQDNIVSVFSKDGELIWDFETDSSVYSVAAGSVMPELEGDEVAAGDGQLYIFNFEYFPTNLSLEIDDNSAWESDKTKLRETETIQDFEEETQDFIDGCTPIEGMCKVPLTLHSDFAGRLGLSDLSIEYTYNVSDKIIKEEVEKWSRTNNIYVNESVGNESIRLKFENHPAVDVIVEGIGTEKESKLCDFNGTQYIAEDNICPVPKFELYSDIGEDLPEPVLFWEDTMPSDKPVLMNKSEPWETDQTDDYKWRKNITVWNTDEEENFTNVTMNATINDSAVVEDEFLNVSWEDGWYDITPNETGDCVEQEEYEKIEVGDESFYVCMEDTNGSGVADFFKWKQPSTSSTNYRIGGSTNYRPILENGTVVPADGEEGYWGDNFTFTVDVEDRDGDDVNLTLLVRPNHTEQWIRKGEMTVDGGSGTAEFEVESDKHWAGVSEYMFEYFDWKEENGDEVEIHSPTNSTVLTGPESKRHPVDIKEIRGDGDKVNRTDSVFIEVRVNNTHLEKHVNESTTVGFWVGEEDGDWIRYDEETNETGYATMEFKPGKNYSVGNHIWIAGTHGNDYYNDTNSTEFNVEIHGLLSIELTEPYDGSVVLRTQDTNISSRLLDEYSRPVGLEGHGCSYTGGGESIFDSTTDQDGTCFYADWTPGCDADLGDKKIEAILDIETEGEDSEFYTMDKELDESVVEVWGELDMSVEEPENDSMHYKNETMDLSGEVYDECEQLDEDNAEVAWHALYDRKVLLNITEPHELERTNEPYILKGEQLSDWGMDLGTLDQEKTNVYLEGEPIPVDTRGENIDEETEILFLVDLENESSQEYKVSWREETETEAEYQFIENGGFESGDLSGWTYENFSYPSSTTPGSHLIDDESKTGRYSLHITAAAEDDVYEAGINQTLQSETTKDVKIKYKSWGDYEDDGSYIEIAGEESCIIDPSERKSSGDAQWKTEICDVGATEKISITVHGVGEGGYSTDAANLLIDYICLSENDECVTLDSGASLETNEKTGYPVTEGRNTSWDSIEDEATGHRRLYAEAWGEYYKNGTDIIDVLLHGWSMVSKANISSGACMYSEEGWICAAGSDLSAECRIADKDTEEGIEGHLVNFALEESEGVNTTDGYGWTEHKLDVPDEIGEYNMTCSIEDDPDVFYNSSEIDEMTVEFGVREGQTNGTLNVSPEYEEAHNITRLENHTFGMNVTLNNTGDGNMLSPVIDIETPEGVHVPEMVCDPIGPGGNCTEKMMVNITRHSPTGLQDVNITGQWTNEDGTTNTTETTTELDIEENTRLDITEDEIRGTFSAGYEGNLANFTVDAFGNTELRNVTLNISGEDGSTMKEWVYFDSENLTETENKTMIETIEKADNETVHINGSIPIGADGGRYISLVEANATDSDCDPNQECWDTSLLNITIEAPDWYREPSEISRTIGSGQEGGTIGDITLSNNLEKEQVFSIALYGNGTEGDTEYIHVDDEIVHVEGGGEEVLDLYHNTTKEEYSEGNHTAEVVIENLNESTPTELNTTVVLEIVPLTAEIIGVGSSEKYYTGPLYAGENITSRVKVTEEEEKIEEGIDFYVEVGGEECHVYETSYGHMGYGEFKGDAWSVDCKVPEIQGNPVVNDMVIEATDENTGVSTQTQRSNAVVYYDILPPEFSEVRVDPVKHNPEINKVTMNVDITDNTEVDSAWVDIDYNGTDGVEIEGLQPDSIEGDTYTFVYENGSFAVGDYDITVYANDTGNIEYPGNGTVYKNSHGGNKSSTLGWFSVYEPMDFYLNLTDPTDETVDANFTWYRPDRHDIKIHEWSGSGEFEDEIHRRKYDLKVDVFGHEVMFNRFDTNRSFIEGNHNVPEDPFRFDYLPDDSYSALRDLPSEFRQPLLGFVVDEENITKESKTVTLDYSKKPLGDIYRTRNLRVLKCDDWNFEERLCNRSLESQDWIDTEPDRNKEKLAFEVEEGSGYILAEACIYEGDLIHCDGYERPDDPPRPGNGADTGDPEDPTEPFPFDYETNLEDDRMFVGESSNYWVMVTNELGENIEVDMDITGGLEEYFEMEMETVELDGGSSRTVGVTLNLDHGVEPGSYSNVLLLESDGRERSLPFEMEVLEDAEEKLTIDIDLIESRVEAGENLTSRIELKGQNTNDNFDVNLTYVAYGLEENKTILEYRENIVFDDVYSGFKEIPVPEDTQPGNYRLEIWAEFNGRAVRDMIMFQVTQPFWATTAGQLMLFLGVPIALLVMVIAGFQARGKFKDWKEEREEKQRYLFPVDYSSIPQKTERSFWIGKLAGKGRRAYYDPEDLRTHVLVAGATGAGKSVGASVFAEEALEKDVPVVVFDPTAQWTGFVNPCEDNDLIAYYDKLGMDKNRRKSYPGMIHKMDDPERDIDFKELMNEGEITVFTLHDLTTEEFDRAVRNIIDSMFEINWEESEELELVVVFDEVHRLLEKYGGKGGYEALERACREFRKWGIGIIMCSQVLSDFKEAIEGNVLTDVQFNTKATQDIVKAKDKYGEKYAKRIARQGIGVAMIQNAQYNDGKPWFIRFRPTWHDPHKLEEDKLEKYEEYSEKLAEIEKKIDSMEEEGKDVFDVRTSLRMAKDKLKSGNFRMAEIYIDSLEEKIK